MEKKDGGWEETMWTEAEQEVPLEMTFGCVQKALNLEMKIQRNL